MKTNLSILVLILSLLVLLSLIEATTVYKQNAVQEEEEEEDEEQVMDMLRQLEQDEFDGLFDHEEDEDEEGELSNNKKEFIFSQASQKQEQEEEEEEERQMQAATESCSTKPIRSFSQKIYIQITGATGIMGEKEIQAEFSRILLDEVTNNPTAVDSCFTITSTMVLKESLDDESPRVASDQRPERKKRYRSNNSNRDLRGGGISYNQKLNIVQIFDGSCRCDSDPINSDAWDGGRRRRLQLQSSPSSSFLRTLQQQQQSVAERVKIRLMEMASEIFTCITKVEFFNHNPRCPNPEVV
eukprot:CAMPEP_0118708576 /NCGR_PEP_ID=MMETSP0800-20121206/21990_1 /TAXON_ID=210618 ORGANISM="Striatella unipunctata, Strain CCMP2910" /NCGR_SAMPLE_ID=MMETSP0800 /ASSEMBLY_ACC=CAM_ASM_000638 /LENGTH=297 /DNA_ID=CAMNT_0006611837 /DNA_START=64 /DNA_END=957 /DNA_ORIENTATION=-